MKSLLTLSFLFISFQSLANIELVGIYDGVSSNGNKKCSLELKEKRYGESEQSVSMIIKATFSKKVFNKKSFKFDPNRDYFYEDASRGYANYSNIDDNPWTDYYHVEDLLINFDKDGSPDRFSVVVEDDRWYRGKVTEQAECSELIKRQ